MEELLSCVLAAFDELELCDGLIFACKNPSCCTWAHWPVDTVRTWWKYDIIKEDIVASNDPNHIRCRIDIGTLVFCSLCVFFDVLKTTREDLHNKLPRLVWRIIEMGKRDYRVRDRIQSKRVHWFSEWIDRPFPPEVRKTVLDSWAKKLLTTKILTLKEKENNGSSQGDT